MTDAAFELHPQLAADTFTISTLPLCRLLLMNDARFPWCILVPQRPDLRELDELDSADGVLLLDEIRRVSLALRATCSVEGLNVAALGNQVTQLHVHVVARTRDDAAWPRPVWGVGTATPYAPDAAAKRISAVREALG